MYVLRLDDRRPERDPCVIHCRTIGPFMASREAEQFARSHNLFGRWIVTIASVIPPDEWEAYRQQTGITGGSDD